MCVKTSLNFFCFQSLKNNTALFHSRLARDACRLTLLPTGPAGETLGGSPATPCRRMSNAAAAAAAALRRVSAPDADIDR